MDVNLKRENLVYFKKRKKKREEWKNLQVANLLPILFLPNII